MNRRCGFLPTPEQELLLKACLARGPETLLWWEQWRQRVDFDRIDAGSLRLVPMLYRTLCRAGCRESSILAKYKGIYRRSWYRNHLVLDALGQAVRAMNRHGVHTMALKGAPLALIYYAEMATRPLVDADLLVRFEQTETAIAALRNMGWQPMFPVGREYRETFHAAPFLHPVTGCEVDLHWHAVSICTGASPDREFWARSAPMTLNGLAMRTLDRTDQFLHACVHGAAWNEVPPLRWAADAMVILRSGPIDWRRLEQDTRANQLLLPMRETLGYLRDRLEADVPGDVLTALRQAPVRRAFQREHRARSRPRYSLGPWLLFWAHYGCYVRSLDAGRPGGLAGLADYFRRALEARSFREAPVKFAAKMAQRLKWYLRNSRSHGSEATAG